MYNQKILEEIKVHCLSDLSKEMGGFLIETNGVLRVFKCSNSHYKPSKFFLINPSEYLEACSQGSIVGVFHSHLFSERFSGLDINFCKHEKVDLILYVPSKDKFLFLTPDCESYNCLSYVKEYYKSSLGVDLIGELEDNIEEKLKENHLVKTDAPKVGDIVLFVVRGKYHFGIYQNDKCFLHFTSQSIKISNFPTKIPYVFYTYAGNQRSN